MGLSALHFASQLLALDLALPFCVVVGVEEADWVLADGFAAWRMASNRTWFPVFGARQGTILAESAASVVLGRSGSLRLVRTSPGSTFFFPTRCSAALQEVVTKTCGEYQPAGDFCSANGTFADQSGRNRVPLYNWEPYRFTPINRPSGDSLRGQCIAAVGVGGKFALWEQDSPSHSPPTRR